ncbi:MAG TPA: BatD family protein [bacterium]
MRAFVWICLLALTIPALAQEKLTASVDHTTVRVGEMVTLILSFSGGASGVSAPTFPALEKLQLAGGPYTSTNFSIVNGRASSTISYSYSLMAREAGTARIGEAVVKYKGKEYKSDPVTVNVLAAGAAAPGSGRSGENADVFIRVIPDKTEAYLGEQLTLTYKIYFASQISNLEPTKSPGTTGFWVEDYPIPSQLTVSREVINGRAYNTATFKKIAIFPTSVGNLTVEPLSISTRIQRSGRQRSRDPLDIFSDPFFGMGSQLEPIEVQSPSVKITVKPLPQVSVPTGFAGAVGNYKIQAALDRNACKTGDAVTLTVTVSGTGNIKTLPAPVISFPTDVDHYDPEASDDIRRTQADINGVKTFKYVVIPRAPGAQVIPAIAYPFFDPDRNSYATATAPELALQVEKGTGASAYSGQTIAEKRKVESVSTDIAFVKTNPGSFQTLGDPPHMGLGFWGLSLAPWAAVAAVVLVSRKREGLSRGRRGAVLKAQKQLDLAQKALKAGKSEAVLHHVAASMDTVLSGAIGIDVADLTAEHLAECWQAEHLDDALLQDVLNVQRECDMARFAAGLSSTKSLQALIEMTRGVVDKLGRAQVKEGART